ncbi:MAG TPA: hypothetical protein DCX32_00860 [Candidatus Moranbacteria bacterium]|nr:MAG: hypothetical protein UW87_C0010G0010 [Candidatus Moranbacteria bacterium GW2011_GWC2_45_10]KKT94701.1 MAG: hypothetical protein UW95_C0010G0008 [Parcubacteria group bacterium GW2011_GWC1_45_14]HAV11088.1 hypothetical protein [Candidatus Moranbacteria bacterium]
MKNKYTLLFSFVLLAFSFFVGGAGAAGYSYDECLADGGDKTYCSQFPKNDTYWSSGSCSSNADCGTGFTCSSGQCIDNYNYMAEGSCKRDSECGSGFECYSGQCVDNSTYGDNTSWYGRLWEGTTDAGTGAWDFLFGGSDSSTGGTGAGGSVNPRPAYVPGPKCVPPFHEVAGVCMPGSELTGLSEVGVLDILAGLLSWLFALFSILAIMAFVISGMQYLVSAGDTGMIEVAKRNMNWSVVGIIVGLSGFLILKAVSAALSGSPIF